MNSGLSPFQDNSNVGGYRAQYHFTVPDHWMNDPQRPVLHNGEYNFYYLYDPDYSGIPSVTAWRHAVTTDMVTFEDRGIAIPKDLPTGTPMSGSAVVDVRNTAGFGANAILALVTQDAGSDGAHQAQWLYYSLDGGTEFSLYGSEPVIGTDNPAGFRDPKVEWDAENNRWVAVITGMNRLMFYVSSNMVNWTWVSDFYPSIEGSLECPDLFQIRADDGTLHWVLGGSLDAREHGGPVNYAYWVGTWNGSEFIANQPGTEWLDLGHDWYAAVTWADHSAPDLTRRFAMGWVNGWAYPNSTRTWPADGFNGTDSIVREIGLKVQPDSTYRLTSKPVSALDDYASRKHGLGDVLVDGVVELPYQGVSFRIETTVTWSSLGNVGVQVRRSPDGANRIEVGYSAEEIYVNREHREPGFPGGQRNAPHGPTTSLELTILVDTTTVEVFAGDRLAMTSEIWSDRRDTGLALYAHGGVATFSNLVITEFGDGISASRDTNGA